MNDDRLRPLAVAADDGHRTIRADLFIADRLNSIVQAHGREVYEAYDREAARLLERGQREKDVRVLDEVCRQLPVAQVVPDALVELGSLHESSRRLAEAAHTYKRLLDLAPDDNLRAQAIWRLAHVYETRKLFVSARDSYLDLQARFPDIHLNGDRDQATFAELVAASWLGPLTHN